MTNRETTREDSSSTASARAAWCNGSAADARTTPADEGQPRSAFGLEPLAGAEALSAGEFVYRQVFDAVMAQRLLPGARLQEEALATIFRVGRSTIRTTLQRLGHEGVVELRANRGAIVARPDVDEVRDVLDARRVIERELARRAAERHGGGAGGDGASEPGRRGGGRGGGASPLEREPFAAVAAIARDEGAQLQAGRRGAALRLAGEFHVALARLGGNPPLADALARLVTRTALAVSAYERRAHGFRGWRSRLDVLDAVAGGDAAAAARAMDRHLDALETSLELETGDASGGDLDSAFAHLAESSAR